MALLIEVARNGRLEVVLLKAVEVLIFTESTCGGGRFLETKRWRL